MKNIFTLGLLMAISFVSAQNTKVNWTVTPEPQKVFIENKGQWSGRNNLPESKVLYATDYGATQILFTKNGLTFRMEKREMIEQDKEEEMERLKGKEKLSHEEWEELKSKEKLENEIDFVQMQWEGANPNAEVVALYSVTQYFNYNMGKGKSIQHANGYTKLLYKNLYKNIDVEYVFHPKGGIEYSFVLHPGADASQIKMKYSDVGNMIIDAQKNLHYITKFGDIIEHAPQTFYQNAEGSKITSSFVRKGKTIGFNLGNYDKTKTVILDPWIVAPAFASQWDCVWECEKDGAGNVYIIGGVTPMQLLKYSPAGALQWTYSTPYDTTSWLGTFAVDNAGNSYVTQGSIAAIQKVSTGGAMIWDNPNPGGIFASTEFWSISFNCDQSKLVIGGTGNTLPPRPYIYQVDMSNGNVTSSVQITGGALFPTQEVRCITACGNGRYYFLTHDSIGFINQNYSVCANIAQAKYYTSNSYALGYKCENFRYNNTGIAALKYYAGFVYSVKGTQVHKRVFATGAIVGTATIPGGAFTTTFGSSYVENSGIDIDANGNVYVGSKNQVVKYDQNLNQLAVYPTTSNFNVYDVHVSTNGDIIACGSAGNSGSGARQGYIQSIAAGAAAPIAITCCDASICQIGPFCTTDAPVTVVASTPGVWSGSGINPGTGVFTPSVAGQGTHYLHNTIGCGSDSIAVTVNLCASLSACREQNGSVTVSNGTGPYTWYQQIQTQDCSACFPAFPPIIPPCSTPTGCAVMVNSWQTFATGSNATPPSYPIRVNDSNGNEMTISSSGSLSPCSVACNLTASTSHNNTTCGGTNGSATAIPAGGTPTAYAWSNGGTAATISNVAAGTYAVTITAGGCSATATAVISSSTGITASASSTNAGCTSTGTATATIGGGTASTYAWSNGGTTATISSLAAGTYNVTITSSAGCTATATTTVGSSGGITLSSTTTGATCGSNNGSATVTVTAGTATGYSWSSGATTTTASNLTAGTYTVTVTGPGGCSATASAVVGSTGAPTITTSATGASCNTSNGSATVTVTSGTATGYSWSSGATTATASGLAAGAYTVTVTGTGGCTVTASVTVNASTGIVINATSTNTSCGNSNGTATINVTQGNATAYSWSNGATTSSLSNLASGTYTVTVSDASGCSATASVIIGGSGGSNVIITSNVTTMCPGDSAQVCAPSGYVSYLWNTGATTSCIYTKLAGNYYVTVTDNGGCTATSNHLAINVHPQPPVSISVNGDTLLAYNSVTYQWFLNGVAIQGANTPLWIATQTGSYTVLITDAKGCSALSLPVVITVTGLNELSRESMSVYPNPNGTSQWNISVSNGWLGANCEVFDTEGRLVYKSEIKNTKSEIELNVASGVYMLRISSGTKNVTQKLIKL